MEKPVVRNKKAIALAFVYDYFTSNKTTNCQEKQSINNKGTKKINNK
tara:strand:- start:1477 stop:1617 length:141 start_codon:yes stop_codon:yes gene_type:complete